MLVYQRVAFYHEHVMQGIPLRFQLEIACIPRVTQGSKINQNHGNGTSWKSQTHYACVKTAKSRQFLASKKSPSLKQSWNPNDPCFE